MRSDDESKILDTLDKIAATEVFTTYSQHKTAILQQKDLLQKIELYRQAKDQYMTAVVESYPEDAKEMYKQKLAEAKKMFDESDVLRTYYKLARNVEFFLDDLNYELTQLLKLGKSGCK